MKSGGGKRKGNAFERFVCKKLSLMITDGRRNDVFWRSAMSGGRATVHNKNNKLVVRQAGDVCSVAPEGNMFCDLYYIECKFYKDLKIDRFVVENKGPLARFWTIAKREAIKHNREPILIAKQNKFPPFVVWNGGKIVLFTKWLKSKGGKAVR